MATVEELKTAVVDYERAVKAADALQTEYDRLLARMDEVKAALPAAKEAVRTNQRYLQEIVAGIKSA